MVRDEKAGHKIINAKYDISLILLIFLKNFINLGQIFRDFYFSFYTRVFIPIPSL